MLKREIVVIGASSGGVEALQTIVRGLPEDFPAAVLIVMHTAPYSPGYLPIILTRAGRLPATHAENLEKIQSGHIYIAPPDHHLLVESPGYVRITRGPKENRFRPAVDPLFRSAAYAFGPRVIGVILTGSLDDGTPGLRAVKQRGGIAVVQDPNDAVSPSMPRSALKRVAVDHCLPVDEIAPLLIRLVSEPVMEGGEYPMLDEMEIELNIAREDHALKTGVMKLGELSPSLAP